MEMIPQARPMRQGVYALYSGVQVLAEPVEAGSRLQLIGHPHQQHVVAHADPALHILGPVTLTAAQWAFDVDQESGFAALGQRWEASLLKGGAQR